MENRVLYQLGMALPLAIATIVGFTENNPVFAQLTPDNTLGAEGSIVTTQQLVDLIRGGAIRDSALFHSFDEFNVGDGRSVFFDLQNNTDILNIFTRVTGGNVSNILGTLGVLQDALNSDVLGNANLFLLNPNGITFGQNASLQLNGSFFATTADGFGFDNFTFSASGEEAPPPLLTISIPRFASFRDNPGDIAVNQSNLSVNQGQNLSLVGGNVSVAGSGDINNLQGSLTAPGGRIELGGLTAAGTVNINPDLSLVFPNGVARGDVSLTDAATLSVVSNAADLNGGSVGINARNLSIIEDSTILAGIGAGFGGDGVTAGDIDLNATGGITISDSFGENAFAPGALTRDRGVQNRVNQGATGTGGNVNVTANSLSITNGGFISTSTFGFGDSGDININVAGALAIDGQNETSFSRLSNVVGQSAVGNSGDIIINADSVSLSNASLINTSVFAPTFDEDGVQTAPGGVGNLGDIQITTNTFTMNSEATINTGTSGVGNAGNVLINATGNVTIDGAVGDSGSTIFSNVNAGGVGNAGDITINAASLSLIDGGQLQTGVVDADGNIPAGRGNAGDITINVTGDVTIGGRSADGLPGAIFNNVESGVIGNAGNVTIQAGGNVTFDDGGINSSIAAGAQGNAGDITINATSLSLLNGSQLQTLIEASDGETSGGIGNAGNVAIDVSGDVIISGTNADGIRSGAFNQVNEGAIGSAGNTTITGNSIFINDGFLDSRNFSDGNAGNIALNASDTVSITNNSSIFTVGNLGNISIGNSLDGDTTFTPRQVIIDSSFLSTGNSVVSAPEFDNVEIDTGNISIYALESISFSNTQDVFSAISTSTNRLGDTGNITLQTLDSGQITFDNIAIQTFVGGVISNDGIITLQGIGNAGTLEIIAGSLNIINDSFLNSSTSGIGNAGLITITAAESISIADSNISNSVFNSGFGNGNDIIINTSSLFLSNGNILSSTTGQGNAGSIQINASESVTFINESILQTATFNQGSAGSITIDVGDGLVSLNDSLLSTGVFSGNIQGEDLISNGNAGDININAGSILLTNGAQLNSSTFGIGNSGNIILNASDSITFDGFDANGNISGAFSQVNPNGIGNAGDIEINSDSLFLTSGAQISSSTFGEGDGGNITINADDTVFFDGIGNNRFSGIFSTVQNTGIGNAGDIEVTANSLSLTDTGRISAGTLGQGDGGNIKINVTDTVLIDGIIDGNRSGIFSAAGSDSTGSAGNISIDPQQVTIRDGGIISVSSLGIGAGGELTIISDNLTLDNGSLTANTVNTDGGNITLDIADLSLLRNGSLISANAGGIGNGGNLTINTTFLIAFPSENSDITASANQGNSGIIEITAEGVLGLQVRDALTNQSDIVAISEQDPSLSGQIIFNTPETNLQPETEVVDSSDIITQSVCNDFGGDSQLANTGRGGIPQIPGLVVRNSVVNIDLVDEVLPAPPPEAIKPHHRTDVTFLDSEGEEFKPAMGAVLLPNGMVEFVDYNPAEVYRDMYAAAGCSGR